MKSSKYAFIIVGVIGLFSILTHWDSYKMENWPALIGNNQALSDKEHVQIAAKSFTVEESKKYLQRDLISRGYQPVQITIQNSTPNAFSISRGSVDVESATAGSVARKVMHSTIPRSIAYKIAGFIFWPFAIPGTIDSIRTLKAYKNLKKDFVSKSMKKEIIAPYSIYNRVVFVPSDQFKESFDVTLIDLESLEPTTLHIDGLKPASDEVIYATQTEEGVSDEKVNENLLQDATELQAEVQESATIPVEESDAPTQTG